MDQPTATLIAGLAAAVGSTAVGVMVIVFAWHNTKATLHQERALLTMLGSGRAELRRINRASIGLWHILFLDLTIRSTSTLRSRNIPSTLDRKSKGGLESMRPKLLRMT